MLSELETDMIHQYKLNGYNIVLDVSSGAVHLVDDLAYDVIALWEKLPEAEIVGHMLKKYESAADVTEAEILEVLGDIVALERAGKLFSPESFAEEAVAFKRDSRIIKALCLHVAHTCNLTCDYCFAKGGKYQGARARMPFEVGKRALDFLIENSGGRRNLEVDFFGGEPLMNWDVVKALVAYARAREEPCGKKFRFTLTTNGLLINDEVIDFANREMDNVVLSLDGRKQVHDRLRRTIGGQGSFDRIVPKFQRLVKARGDKGYYIRGTFTHYNTDFINDILEMAGLGFTQLSMEPVVCPPGDPYALTQADLPELLAQYELLAKEMDRRNREGEGFTFYHYMLDLTHGPCVYKRVAGCGSGTEYLAVTPSGELFPCHQFVGDPAYLMGDVWRGVTNTALRDALSACNVYTRKECRECWARLYCSGGCAANAYHATGSIDGVYAYGCQLFKKRVECAIMLQAAENGNEASHA